MLFIGMFRILVTFIVIIVFWYIICLLFELPSFILPSPDLVAIALFNNFSEILNHSLITLLEILLSLFFGIVLGSFFAVLISLSERLKRWIMPLLLASQSIPVFALAPILVLWFGYGISSKVVIGTIIVFFPIASNFSDALNKIPKEYIVFLPSIKKVKSYSLSQKSSSPYIKYGNHILQSDAQINERWTYFIKPPFKLKTKSKTQTQHGRTPTL